jgi:O-methyltransferase
MRAASSDDAARLLDAQAHLAAARPPGAAGAGPDAETLRVAYLDLLKLSLCDLAGTTTMSVGAMPGGRVMSRELSGDGLRLRAAGMDWPLQGLTMVGLGRLDDLQACVESVVADGVDGDLIEAGAWRGGASILMRGTLDTLGDERTVWMADSFQGFPEAQAPDDGSIDLGAFDFLRVSLAEVRDSFARFGCERGVRFVPGFFQDTLAALGAERWAIVRLDADSYEATREALRRLYPGLAAGGHLIVDDYGSFEGCRRAVDEFRAEHGIAEPIERVDFTCSRWRRTSDHALDIAPLPASAPRRPPRTARDGHVPTAHELDLEREVADLRRRLEAAEAALASGIRARVRGTLRRLVRR